MLLRNSGGDTCDRREENTRNKAESFLNVFSSLPCGKRDKLKYDQSLSPKYSWKSSMAILTDSRDSAEVDGCSFSRPSAAQSDKCSEMYTQQRDKRGRGEKRDLLTLSLSLLPPNYPLVRPPGCCRLNPKPRRGRRSQLLRRDGRTKIEGRGKNSQVFTPSSSSSFSRRGPGATVGPPFPLPLLSRVSPPSPKKERGGGLRPKLEHLLRRGGGGRQPQDGPPPPPPQRSSCLVSINAPALPPPLLSWAGGDTPRTGVPQDEGEKILNAENESTNTTSRREL